MTTKEALEFLDDMKKDLEFEVVDNACGITDRMKKEYLDKAVALEFAINHLKSLEDDGK